MILQVRSDARAVEQHRDAAIAQMVGRADAGQHEKLRRSDRACAEDDLAIGLHRIDRTAALHPHAVRPTAVERNGEHGGIRFDMKIRTRQRGMQKCPRRAPAFAVFLGDVKEAKSVLRGTVEVGIERKLALQCSLDERSRQRMRRALRGDVQFAALSMQRPFARLEILRLAKIRQHIRERPAVVPECGPFVIILRLPAHVDHAVDRGSPAKQTAARAQYRAAVGACGGCGRIKPIVAAVVAEQDAAGRNSALHVDREAAVG